MSHDVMPNPYGDRLFVERYEGHEGEMTVDIMVQLDHQYSIIHYFVHHYTWMADTQVWAFNKSIFCQSLKYARQAAKEILE